MIETIVCAEALDGIADLDFHSIDCVVTSPPYWRQRDYGFEGQMGQEKTSDEYVQVLTETLHSLRGVLKPEGTVWLNIGDTFFKKNLELIPARVALELQRLGWYVRSDVIWNKPNAIPDSGAKRRLGRSYEHVFLLTRRTDHFFDADTIREPAAWERWGDQTTPKGIQGTGSWIKPKSKEELQRNTTKRKRDVWTIPNANHTGDHSAVFPEALVEPCVLAGCPAGGVVLDPFAGTGTVGVVARRLSRGFVLIDNNPDTVEYMNSRLKENA